MPYFYVKVQKNIDICNFLNGYYCHFYGVRGLFQCPLKRGGLVCPPLEGPMIFNGTDGNLCSSAESVGD